LTLVDSALGMRLGDQLLEIIEGKPRGQVEDRAGRAGDRDAVEGADLVGPDCSHVVDSESTPRTGPSPDDRDLNVGLRGRFGESVRMGCARMTHVDVVTTSQDRPELDGSNRCDRMAHEVNPSKQRMQAAGAEPAIDCVVRQSRGSKLLAGMLNSARFLPPWR
jgi:hypothetical protein